MSEGLDLSPEVVRDEIHAVLEEYHPAGLTLDTLAHEILKRHNGIYQAACLNPYGNGTVSVESVDENQERTLSTPDHKLVKRWILNSLIGTPDLENITKRLGKAARVFYRWMRLRHHVNACYDQTDRKFYLQKEYS